jgi:TonB family protein
VNVRPDFLAAAAAALSLAVGVSFATPPSLIAKKDSSTRLTPVDVGETVPDTTFDEPPRVLKQVRAKFPWPWRPNGYEGFVLVNLLIDSTGHVSQAKVELRAPADIDSAVVQAARRWIFSPARKRGRPVATRWHISVELRHPRSGELASRRNRTSVSRTYIDDPDAVWGIAMARISGSAYFDSVSQKYCYSYELENQSTNGDRVAAFALLGCAEGVVDEWDNPDHWNGMMGCGGRRDVLGWIIWDRDSTGSYFTYAARPGSSLTRMQFKSRLPPGTVSWVAQTAVESEFESILVGCSQSSSDVLQKCTLSGTIVGPVQTRKQ